MNPEAWLWYFKNVGNNKCPIMDTWWQTETGGILITPLPGVTDLKPGSATLPFFGIKPAIVDKEGKVVFHAAKILEDTTDGVWIGGLPKRLTLITVGQEFVRIGQSVETQYEADSEVINRNNKS